MLLIWTSLYEPLIALLYRQWSDKSLNYLESPRFISHLTQALHESKSRKEGHPLILPQPGLTWAGLLDFSSEECHVVAWAFLWCSHLCSIAQMPFLLQGRTFKGFLISWMAKNFGNIHELQSSAPPTSRLLLPATFFYLQWFCSQPEIQWIIFITWLHEFCPSQHKASTETGGMYQGK